MGRFLDDVISFFTQMSSFDGNADCQFHTQLNRSDDASYHDMAELFGFSGETPAYIYQCMLDGDHDHRACFADFSRKLNHFFDGEHPTRKNYFAPENALASVKPARTVYTGNYVIRSDMLDYFIPFANLKLRMAGPVLGRIVQAELGVAFVSANLPMLHKRTVENLGQSEYRAGVNRQQQNVDLHEEFERQYFGDVMLFTVADLIDSGNFLDSMSQEVIEKTVSRIEAGLFEKYMARREQIQNKLQTLKILFNSQQQWWHTDINMDESVLAVNAFMENVEYNFADVARAYQLITSAEHKQARCNAIVNAIKHYPEHRKSWQQAMQDINLSL